MADSRSAGGGETTALPSTVLGPTWSVASEPIPELSREAAFAPPPPEPLHDLLLLEDGEQILQVAPLATLSIVLTSRALYVYAPSSGRDMIGKFIDSVFSSTPRIPPKLRQGHQVWRRAVAGTAVITRIGLEIVEAASVRKQQDGTACALCCSVPRSAVPHTEQHFPTEASTKDSTKTTSAPRASLFFAVGDATECRAWQVAVRQVVRARWQQLLEASCIAAPEVYQLHSRAKLLAPRAGGAPLSRMLVLSDRRVYSVKREGMSLRGAGEWRADVEAISAIEQHTISSTSTSSSSSSTVPPRDRSPPLPPSYPHGVSIHWHAGRAPDGTAQVATFALKSAEEVAAVVAAARYAHVHATGRPLELLGHAPTVGSTT